MPLYEYRCEACGKETELEQKINDDYRPTCEHQDQNGDRVFFVMKRQISKTGFTLKGSGWARDKYGR